MQLQTPVRTRYQFLLAGARVIASPVDELYPAYTRAMGGRLDKDQMCGALRGGRRRLEAEVVAPLGARPDSDGTRSALMPIDRVADGYGAQQRRWPSVHVWEAVGILSSGPGDDPREARDPDQWHPARDAGRNPGGRSAR